MTAFDRQLYQPDSSGPTGLFLDTSGLFARFYPNAAEHAEVLAFFDEIVSGTLPYRPLVTNTYVLDELATLLVTTGRHDHAQAALSTLADSEAISIERERTDVFEQARETFLAYDDREISFTDHYCVANMNERSIDHVLAFDGDYEALGCTAIPRR